MKVIGYNAAGNADTLEIIEMDQPVVGPRDLLVAVEGISVNPVDVKLRAGVEPDGAERVLGFDAAGVVTEIGNEVTGYKVGDAVYYAGDVTRAGTNAEFHAVDERIVGRKPASLDFVEAAGLPLTSITAWEMLFDAFRLTEGGGSGQTLLVIGGAGGVGSILIQLAKALTGLTVIATASRPETQDWVRKMGADHVVDHRGDLAAQVADLGLVPSYVAALTATDQHWPAIIDLIAPRGQIALIDDPEALDIKAAKPKALSIHWEFMFTRSMFGTEDIGAQRDLLNRVAEMIDAGTLQSTVTEKGDALTVDALRAAHLKQESGRVIGKQVLGGF
ncbi:zinc-binding alcohol dehydrogenase family protein [Sulfitobacter sp. M220]|jgi:NADPH2:quinone reductase|uniref:zinc-binding alcohol dehydrogenase family protein n=1 Tax=unclassified Sulfitobacter TaxID=196795 RepID=UPI001EF02E75|nr:MULTISPECIES: zinc-binding alcohol dehydrogenase family protein [unclassified Sulfitobacter]MCF7726600.1 zinc-binding alcohol dehydrogenase family protein [Sulfitobacter sp. M22]MCF7777942.1 zinc-binding alcohol dehydrogenase family protein [Sulfitobacter sp. M220]|tara:strand:+ start:939 stop:1934 length:996 start_codon:yes stop_codon:yes gene_type:complete